LTAVSWYVTKHDDQSIDLKILLSFLRR